MYMPGSYLREKAQLLEEGKIFIRQDIVMPCFASRSTAGPDAGTSSYAFEFKGSRVKLEVSRDPGTRFRLSKNENHNSFIILDKAKEFIKDVKVLSTPAHSPNQAFINLSSRCIFGCRFCSTSAMEMALGGELDSDRVLRIIDIASEHPGFEAVAITSGIAESPSLTNRKIAEVIKSVRERYPDLPIGVEAHFEDLRDVRMVRNAGADEIKVNIEVWPEALFEKVCPARDRKRILEALDKTVRVFGRGKVASNIIIGLGERDSEVEEGVDALAERGIVPNLRGIRVNKLNEDMLSRALGTRPKRVKAERLLKLAEMHKKVLTKHDLTTLSFKTMCFSCQCCDIVPMRDL